MADKTKILEVFVAFTLGIANSLIEKGIVTPEELRAKVLKITKLSEAELDDLLKSMIKQK